MPTFPQGRAVSLLLLGLFLLAPVRLPAQQQAPVPPVNTQDRRAVVELYRNFYGDPTTVPTGWTGSVAAGIPGDLSDDYRRLTVQRVNYFRVMSGLPGNVVFDPAGNAICQQAALVFAAQKDLSHTPPPTWKWWTADAAKAAGGSDIRCESASVDEGPDAVTRYIEDHDLNNTYVGHRRWLLYPGQTTMASGSVPATPGFWAANAIWVSGPFGPRPASTPEWTAWPPAGFVPASLVFNRWSFSLCNADFTNATVLMTKNGASLPVLVRPPEYQSGVNGVTSFIGDNTLVWEPQGNVINPGADEVYSVTVDNVVVGGQARRFLYTVTSLDPNAPLPPAPVVPVASLGVSVPEAVRRSAAKGKFVVNLSAPAPTGLAIAYTVDGSAIGGDDYRALDGVAWFPAGSTKVKIRVVPSPDLTGDTVRTVTVLLQPGPGYTVNPAASVGHVLIVDE